MGAVCDTFLVGCTTVIQQGGWEHGGVEVLSTKHFTWCYNYVSDIYSISETKSIVSGILTGLN